ncbi:hypothetical protein [Corynebacterium caspium]|nr:hypothetical protein [Corynebacterium caspium]
MLPPGLEASHKSATDRLLLAAPPTPAQRLEIRTRVVFALEVMTGNRAVSQLELHLFSTPVRRYLEFWQRQFRRNSGATARICALHIQTLPSQSLCYEVFGTAQVAGVLEIFTGQINGRKLESFHRRKAHSTAITQH